VAVKLTQAAPLVADDVSVEAEIPRLENIVVPSFVKPVTAIETAVAKPQKANRGA